MQAIPQVNLLALSRPLDNKSMRSCIASHIKAIIRKRQLILELSEKKHRRHHRQFQQQQAANSYYRIVESSNHRSLSSDSKNEHASWNDQLIDSRVKIYESDKEKDTFLRPRVGLFDRKELDVGAPGRMENVSLDFNCDDDVRLNFSQSRLSDSIAPSSIKNSLSISNPLTGIVDSFSRPTINLSKYVSEKKKKPPQEPFQRVEE